MRCDREKFTFDLTLQILSRVMPQLIIEAMLAQLQRRFPSKSLVQVVKKLKSTSAPAATAPQVRSNKKCKYTIEEITIPTGTGTILAGQLWQGEEIPSLKSLPPIICTHGTLDNAASFQGLLPLVMKPNMKVLCVDFPGHGLSSHLQAGHYDQTVDGCKTILQTYKYLQSPKVILMGHSHGAGSSLLFSAVYPELTDRLIAIEFHPLTIADPIAYVKYLMERQLGIDEKLAAGNSSPSYTYEEILQKLYQGRHESMSWQACQRLIERGTKKLPDGKYAFSYDLRATILPPGRFTMEQWEKFCAAIKCPVTVIKAEPGIGNDDAEELVTRMKKYDVDAQLHFVPGSHFVHMNEPDLIAPLINSALKP